MPSNVKPWNMGEVNRVRLLRHRCYSVGEIAEDLGRSFGSVRAKIREFKIPLPNKFNRARLIRCLKENNPRGWSDGKIARHLGVSYSTVSKYRRKLGLPLVPRKVEPSVRERQADSREAIWMEKAVSNGWPKVPWGQLRILQALESLGGCGTVNQINEVNGTKYRGSDYPWHMLLLDGFIFVREKQKWRKGVRGCLPMVFQIAEDVAERRQRHKEKSDIQTVD